MAGRARAGRRARPARAAALRSRSASRRSGWSRTTSRRTSARSSALDPPPVRRTTARSCGSRCWRSARSPPSRSTCSSTRRSSGHLGRSQLAALGISAHRARRRVRALQLPHLRDDRAGGARLGRRRARHGARARRRRRSGSRSASALALAVVLAALAEPLVAAMGGDGKTADYAVLVHAHRGRSACRSRSSRACRRGLPARASRTCARR